MQWFKDAAGATGAIFCQGLELTNVPKNPKNRSLLHGVLVDGKENENHYQNIDIKSKRGYNEAESNKACQHKRYSGCYSRMGILPIVWYI